MLPVALGVIVKDGKVLVGTLKPEKRKEYLGIPAILLGGDVEGENELESKLKHDITRKTGVEIEVEGLIAQREHPVTKRKVYYFACRITGNRRVRLASNSYFEKVTWEDVFTASLKMLSLYTKVFAFLLARIGRYTLHHAEQISQMLEWYEQDIKAFGRHVAKGELVAFPTETIYGLGANAKSKTAVAKIFAAKGRPADNPLIVHVASPLDISKVAYKPNKLEQKLIKTFTPGPLTVILRRKVSIPDITVAGLKYVGVRIPNNSFALELIQAANAPIAAPSANISGKPSATHHQHVLEYFGDSVKVIKAGYTNTGVESTVVKVEGKKIFILRQGALAREDIAQAIPEATVQIAGDTDNRRKASPGSRYRHYAPNAHVTVVSYSKSISTVVRRIEKEVHRQLLKNDSVVVIAADEVIKELAPFAKNVLVLSLGPLSSPGTALFRLFDYFLRCDKDGVPVIVIHEYPMQQLGLTFNERVRRAEKG